MDDADPGLDVGEGVGGGHDGLPLTLVLQLPVGTPVLGEGGRKHEPLWGSQIEAKRDPLQIIWVRTRKDSRKLCEEMLPFQF